MAPSHSPLVYSALTAVVVTFGLAFISGCEGVAGDAIVEAGSCEGDTVEKDMDTGFEELETTFGVSVDGADIVIAIDNIDANCCPSPGADVTFSDADIHVDFQDVTGDDGCLCTCTTDFEIRIPDVDPGDYTIDLDYNGDDLDTLEITVPA